MMAESLAVLLVGLVLIGAALLVVAYTWYFIFQRSPLRLLIMFIRNVLDKDHVVPDPNAPINVPTDAHYSDVLKYEADLYKQEDILPGGLTAQTAPPAAQPVPKAVLPAQELVPPGETTSQSGWPVPLDKEVSASPRPFLHIDYHTTDHVVDVPEQNDEPDNTESP
jgi:hypothetical protein